MVPRYAKDCVTRSHKKYSGVIFSCGPHMQRCCTISLHLATWKGLVAEGATVKLYFKRNNIVLLALAFYRSSTYLTATALHTISYSNSNARQDACVAKLHFTVMQLLKDQSHSIYKVSSQKQGYGATPLHVCPTTKYCSAV